MKKITYDDLKLTFPKLRTNLPTEKNYLDLYSLYHSLVVKFLIKELGIDKFDNYFSSSPLNYIKEEEKDMDIYQYLSSSSLNYFYLRNNIHLERLSKDYIDYFNKKLEEKNEELDETTESVIKATMKNVLEEKEDKNISINFGPPAYQYYAPANSLILGFRYDEFNAGDMTDEEWHLNNQKQISDVFQKITMLQIEAERFSIMPIKIIQYDIYSVKKKASIASHNL